MTVILVISLPNILYIHRTYMVLANPSRFLFLHGPLPSAWCKIAPKTALINVYCCSLLSKNACMLVC